MGRDGRVVLAASDLSEQDAGTVTYAAQLADRLDRPLVIVHAVEVPMPVGPGVMTDRSLERLLREARRGAATQAGAVLRAYPGLDVRTAVIVGRPGDVIVDVARDAFVAVVGAGNRRSGVAGRLLARTPCPVIVVPAGSAGIHPGPVVVGVRADGASEAATAFAGTLLGSRPSYVVTVRPEGECEVNLESGALPVDRLIIRVVAPGRALVPLVVDVAAEYGAALVVLDQMFPRRRLRPTSFAAVRALGGAVACPIAVVDRAYVRRAGGSSRGPDQRKAPDHANRPHAAVG